MTVVNKKNLKKSIVFTVLVLTISYLLVFAYSNLVDEWSGRGSAIVTFIYMFIPMTVAIFLQKFIYKKSLKKRLRISLRFNKWFIVAWLFPVFLAFLTLGVSLLFPGIKFSPETATILENSRSQISPEQMEQAKSQIAAFTVHPIWISWGNPSISSAQTIAWVKLNPYFCKEESNERESKRQKDHQREDS